MVFTPKWARDTEPGNRIYCVIERWENEELFNRVYGSIPAMLQRDSLSLQQMRQRLNQDATQPERYRESASKVNPDLSDRIVGVFAANEELTEDQLLERLKIPSGDDNERACVQAILGQMRSKGEIESGKYRGFRVVKREKKG